MTADSERRTPEDRDIARSVLGRRLKEAREAAGLTQEEASGELDWSKSKIIRHEGGDQGTTLVAIRALLALYGVDDAEAAGEMEALAKASRGQPWWSEQAELVPSRVGIWLGHEAAAVRLLAAGSPYVPDLLQTGEYAAALLTGSEAVPPGAAGPHCALLAARQERLAGGPGARAEFIIHEAALMREIGGRRVLGRQLDHLAAVAAGERPGVSVRVVPSSAPGAAAAMWQAFTIAETPYGDMLFTGSALMATAGVWGQGVHDTPAPGPDFREVFDRAEAGALTPAETADFLRSRSGACDAPADRHPGNRRLAAARAPGSSPGQARTAG